MSFEFDPEKSAANKAKHGIDLEEAQALWTDPALPEIPARTTDEPRRLAIGMMGGKHRPGAMTRRGEHIRLISVRRSRDEEVELYESGKV